MLKMEKKFKVMDKMVREYDDMSLDERDEIVNKELDGFIALTEVEKLEAYDKLFNKAILNKRYCIRRSQDHLKTSIDYLEIIKQAVNNASTDVILSSIDELSTMMIDDFNTMEEEMRYCKK